MTLISISVLIFISCSTTLALSPLCGTVCHCENDEEEGLVMLDCSRVYLSIVPPVPDWPGNVTHMDLSSNNISTLDIELSHSTLRVLDLSHNKIRTVIRSAFGGLRSLEYLNLARNDITVIEENGFYGLDQLKSLNLSSNGLEKLPDLLFYPFVGLQELSLAENPLVHLDPIHFNRMISLRWLDLSDIDAYDLESKIFHTTGQLEFLDLSDNDFDHVPIIVLRGAKRLKHLRLNGNPISELTRNSFTKLQNLEILQMNYLDKLKVIKEEVFSELTSLRILEMRYNRHFHFISPMAFEGLFNVSRPVLEELDLQGNQLRILHKTMVPCARLRKFNLQQNPWLCDCMFKWIKDCEIQAVYLADLKCASPSELSDSLIVHVKDEEFKCDFMETDIAKEQMHHDRLVRSVTVGLGVTMLVFLSFSVALVFKWRGIKEWYRKTRKGPGAVYYVKARANPREA